MFEVGEPTVVFWFQQFRDVCSNWLVANPRQIGGNGAIVQIDESLMAKRKNNVGHVVQQRWVFGGVCPATGQGFLGLVPNRNANTLLPLIVRHIAPGSIIHSDQWAAYNGIANLPVQPPFQHLTVNHSQNFVCPVTGAHTNHVECYWKNAKKRFKAMCGVQNSTLDSHLDEFLWRQIHGSTPQTTLDTLLAHIAAYRPTP